MAKPSKPRITLADLESVEVSKVDVAVLTAGDPEPVAGDVPAPADSAELNQLPVGVSPDVAAMLAPEPEPEPEPVVPSEPVVPAVVAAPEPEASGSKLGIAAAVLLLVAGAAAAFWFTRPPELDPTLYEGATVVASAPGALDTEVGFVPIPDPIVAAPEVEEQPAPRRSGSRRSPRQVRSEDLF